MLQGALGFTRARIVCGFLPQSVRASSLFALLINLLVLPDSKYDAKELIEIDLRLKKIYEAERSRT